MARSNEPIGGDRSIEAYVYFLKRRIGWPYAPSHVHVHVDSTPPRILHLYLYLSCMAVWVVRPSASFASWDGPSFAASLKEDAFPCALAGIDHALDDMKI